MYTPADSAQGSCCDAYTYTNRNLRASHVAGTALTLSNGAVVLSNGTVTASGGDTESWSYVQPGG